jgi:hypothetical protein
MVENERETMTTVEEILFKHNKSQEVDWMWRVIFNGRKIEALYLWFVFMNQPTMAKYLCSRSRVR